MKVRTKNVPEEVISKKELCEVTKFYASKLLTKKLYDSVSVVIEFKELKDCKGLCEWMDKPVKARQYKITLNSNYKKKTSLITLAHEMVHLKQYAKGELTDETLRSKAKWKKKVINENKIGYWDLPYEIEAYGREYGLYYNYVEHNRSKAAGTEPLVLTTQAILENAGLWDYPGDQLSS